MNRGPELSEKPSDFTLSSIAFIRDLSLKDKTIIDNSKD
jgi:hypothetical protein